MKLNLKKKIFDTIKILNIWTDINMATVKVGFFFVVVFFVLFFQQKCTDIFPLKVGTL